MKQIFLSTLLIHMAVIIHSQKFAQDQILYSTQFQTPSSIHSPDRTIYLPPDSESPLPHFSINGMNKLPFQFLLPSQTKAPTHFPTPLSVILSSTYRSNVNDDVDEDDEQDDRHHRHLIPSFTLKDHINRTVSNKDRTSLEKKVTPASSRMYNFQPQTEKGRPNQVTIGNKEKTVTSEPKPAARRMIITSEIQKTDHGPDEIKDRLFQNTQHTQASGFFVSSTTEPAIPIIRLSNEMDLDGSFSYEALGADQTHYVQHSHMENLGTDKEEQVVQGSYSYVGDDGRTYTVHYIADSNGYRASGDHLPSPPPVPEIIQRAIQYNLAEEEKRPPHMRNSWENEENDYENKEESMRNYFSVLSHRNLFTGKTPEAFSFSHSTIPQSNLVTAASFHNPTKYNNEKEHDQLKTNTPITPQITFLASQGAHSPSLQKQQSQPTVQKTANTEKSSLPQLMNYEAAKPEQEVNKPLWRWQYGYNNNANHVQNKNSISRSFTEGDDVIINFSDMTPGQYSQMIQTQISAQNEAESNKIEGDNTKHYHASYSNINPETNIGNRNILLPSSRTYNSQSVTVISDVVNGKEESIITTPKNDFYGQEPNELTVVEANDDLYQYPSPDTNNPAMKSDHPEERSKIISSHNFYPENQMVTQTYSFEETQFEPTKININNENATVSPLSEYKIDSFHSKEFSIEPHEHFSTPLSNLYTDKHVTPFNYYQINEQSSLKPVLDRNENKPDIHTQGTTTTEPSVEQIIEENIFLRNLFKTPNVKESLKQELPPSEDNDQYQYNNPEQTSDKSSTLIDITPNPINEVRVTKAKPLNLNDVFNYVVMKNHFESAKTKPKSKSTHSIQYNKHMNEKDTPVRYTQVSKEINKNQEESQDYLNLNRQQQQELHGLIKNYKILQRQKNGGTRGQNIHEPQRHIKTFHSPGLPPLGRAGPSMKTYFPPLFT